MIKVKTVFGDFHYVASTVIAVIYASCWVAGSATSGGGPSATPAFAAATPSQRFRLDPVTVTALNETDLRVPTVVLEPVIVIASRNEKRGRYAKRPTTPWWMSARTWVARAGH